MILRQFPRPPPVGKASGARYGAVLPAGAPNSDSRVKRRVVDTPDQQLLKGPMGVDCTDAAQDGHGPLPSQPVLGGMGDLGPQQDHGHGADSRLRQFAATQELRATDSPLGRLTVARSRRRTPFCLLAAGEPAGQGIEHVRGVGEGNAQPLQRPRRSDAPVVSTRCHLPEQSGAAGSGENQGQALSPMGVAIWQ